MDLYDIKLQEHIANLKVKNKREAALQEIFEYCIKQLRNGQPILPAAANYLADALQSVLNTPQEKIPINATEKQKKSIARKNSNDRKNAITKSLKISAGNNLRVANTYTIGSTIEYYLTRSGIYFLAFPDAPTPTLNEILILLAEEYQCDERTIRNIYDKYRKKYKKISKIDK